MTELVFFSLRVCVVLWLVDRLRASSQPDYEIGKLQKQIKFWGKVNEEIGMYVVGLHERHKELVET